MREEFVDPQFRAEDHIELADETGLRPKSLDEFVGQRELKEHLGIVLEAARRRGQSGQARRGQRSARNLRRISAARR